MREKQMDFIGGHVCPKLRMSTTIYMCIQKKKKSQMHILFTERDDFHETPSVLCHN